MAKDFKTTMLQIWRKHLRPILIIVLVFTAFRSAVADWNDVPTGSMKPTIVEGDRIYVNKLAYGLKIPFTTVHLLRWGHPERGEIVVFYAPDTGIRLVKRVVGLPGDRIAIRNDRLWINGKPVEYAAMGQDGTELFRSTEYLGSHPHVIQEIGDDRGLRDSDTGRAGINKPFNLMRVANMDEITLGAGEYFMMGDNRDNSRDSRFFGTVKESQILGRASRVVFSLDYDDHYLPRGNRFFKALP